jgi:hypothetical protein
MPPYWVTERKYQNCVEAIAKSEGGAERNASVRTDHRLSVRHGSDFRGDSSLAFCALKEPGDRGCQFLA